MKLKKVVKDEVNAVEKKDSPKKKRMTQRGLLEEKLKFLEGLPTLTFDQMNEKEELKEAIKRSKRGKSSKNKGASYERVIAKKFQQVYGVELTRTPQSGGFAKKSDKAEEFRGDIIPLEKGIDLKLHLECKDHKSWSLPQWIKQSSEDCPKDKMPVVIFHKHNTSKDYVTLTLEDFLSLVDKEKIFEKKGRK